MPRLNLKDDGMEEEPLPLDSDKPMSPPPTLRDVGGGGGGGGRSVLLLIIAILVVLAAAVFALNYFKVIKLWGKKAPATAQLSGDLAGESVPPASGSSEMPPPDLGTGAQTTAPEPTPEPAPEPMPAAEPTPTIDHPKPAVSTSGTGNYTIQVSSWESRSKADKEAAKLTSAGYTAFVEEATVGAQTWYRVRVGHYATTKEAREAAAELSKIAEAGAWVARVGE